MKICLKASAEKNLVVGKRYLKGKKTKNTPKPRDFLSQFIYIF